ncbi:MAG: hypothetical protein ACOX23_00630 [Peptococcia bacterium]
MASKANILLVDDEKLFVKGLTEILEREGFQVYQAFDGRICD